MDRISYTLLLESAKSSSNLDACLSRVAVTGWCAGSRRPPRPAWLTSTLSARPSSLIAAQSSKRRGALEMWAPLRTNSPTGSTASLPPLPHTQIPLELNLHF